MIKNNLRYNRLADGSPVPHVAGSDEARFTLRTTGDASENGSFRSIAFVYSMAIGAFPAGVMWINYNDGNAQSFTLYSINNLIRRKDHELWMYLLPFLMVVLILMPSRFFDGNCGGDAFGFMNNLLRHQVCKIQNGE